MNNSQLLGTLTYTTILVIHFWYARYVLKNKLFSLALGLFSSEKSILALLVGLNGISLSAFIFTNNTWVWINIGLHLVLTLDEVLRTLKERRRWPFLLNHLLFAAVLFGFCFNS